MASPRLEGLIRGLHHITLVTSSEEVNRRFYTEVLGLRRVKLTVNQDDVYHRHLFYADEKGTTGSAITFFEWPGLPRGQVGLGSPHHLSYSAPGVESLPKWASWLRANGVSTVGPVSRDGGRVSLYLRDPDGVVIELAARGGEGISPGYLEERVRNQPPVAGVGAEMRLTTFDHASPITTDPDLTARFLDRFVGLKKGSVSPNPDQGDTNILAVGNEERPDFLRYLASDRARDGYVGDGSVHHIAMAVEEDEDQARIMRHLDDVGVRHSGIIDRFWFRSLYFRDPDGNLLEIATKKPGYAVDEPPEKLGSRLVLPAWLEPRRREIEATLNGADEKNPGRWPPTYPAVPPRPEAVPQAGGLPGG